MATPLPLQNRISQDATESGFHKLASYEFGDGYISTVATGVNNKKTEWTIKWQYLNSTEFTTVKTVIDSVGGTGVVTWTPPDYSSTKYFKIKVQSDGKLWNKTFDSGDLKTISIDLYEIVYTGV